MEFSTQQKLIDKVLGEIALVGGSGVQTYTEPLILHAIQTAFDHVFSKRFWGHLTETTYHTLDGVTGISTTDLVGIKSAQDIKWIRHSPYRECDKIHFFPDGQFDSSRYGYTTLPYTDTEFFESRVIKFNPKTEALDIAIHARRKPDDFIREKDIVPFDRVYLQHFVTASILATDGTNPAEQTRQEALYNDRYETLVMNESNEVIVGPVNRYQPEFTVAEE